jgi:hypothetical protein
MKIYVTPFLGILIIFTIATTGTAVECDSQFSPQQRQVYASLSPANQHILTTAIQTKNGEPASCDFQRGLLDILANYTPDKRDAGFKQLLDHLLIYTR